MGRLSIEGEDEMTMRGMSKVVQMLALVGCAAFASGCGEALAGEQPAGERVATAELASSAGCNFRQTERAYGFSCAGSSSVGAGLVPITIVGVVSGDGKGAFSGRGTLSSPGGSFAQRVKGSATLDADCFGRVTYDVNEIEVAPGTWIPLPPLVIDFAVVDDGAAMLGAPVAPGRQGDDVPRVTCQLKAVTRRR
jgi:hypothetical protein